MCINRALPIFVVLLLSFASIAAAEDDSDFQISETQPAYQQHLAIVNQQLDQVQGNTNSQASSTQNEAPRTTQELSNVNVTTQNVSNCIHKKSPFTFNVTPELSRIKYHEVIDVTDRGTMAGVNLGVTYRPPEGSQLNSEISNMYRLETRISYGKVDCNGALIDLNTGATTPYTYKGISDSMLELRGLIGKDYIFGPNTLTPYVGLGYRYLNDNAAVLEGGYNRHIYYLYIPAGFEYLNQLNKDWAIGGSLEYDFFAWGEADSYATEGNVPIQNVRDGWFWNEGSLKIIKKYNYFNIYLEPYLRYWHIYQSKPKTVMFNDTPLEIVEPENNSLEIGGKLGEDF